MLLDLEGEELVRLALPSTSKAKFFDQSEELFYVINKQETTYSVTIYQFDGKKSCTIMHQLVANFYKPEFEYLKFDSKRQLLFFHTKLNLIEIYKMGKKLMFENSIETKTPIVDFYLRPEKAFVIAFDVFLLEP